MAFAPHNHDNTVKHRHTEHDIGLQHLDCPKLQWHISSALSYFTLLNLDGSTNECPAETQAPQQVNTQNMAQVPIEDIVTEK